MDEPIAEQTEPEQEETPTPLSVDQGSLKSSFSEIEYGRKL